MDALKFIIEILGTFLFLSVILNSLSDNSITPISIVVALLAVIYFGGRVSGGHFNPAVSVAMFLKKNITVNLLVGYIISQLIGAGLAVKFNDLVLANLNK
jgi:aquaporin Z